MNKKGFALSAGSFIPLALGIIIVIGAIAVLASPEFRMTAIGAGIIALAMIFAVPAALQGDFTKEKGIFLAFMFFVGCVILLIPYTGLIQQEAFELEGYFELPIWGTIECASAPGGEITSGEITIPSAGIVANCPVNTQECDIGINYEGDTIGTRRYVNWQICESDMSNCGTVETWSMPWLSGYTPEVRDHKIINDMSVDSIVAIEIGNTISRIIGDGIEGGSALIHYEPYILWRDDVTMGGRNPLTDSADCEVPAESGMDSVWSNAITFSNVLSQSGDTVIVYSDNRLKPDETFNYVTGTFTRASLGNMITYNGQDGYCVENTQGENDAIIYKIGRIETNSVIYNIVDLNTELGREDCCTEGAIELSRVCQDYVWTTVDIDPVTGDSEIECGIQKPCPVGVLEYSDTESFQWQCIESTCHITDIKTVECTDNAQCGTNEICINFACESGGTVKGQDLGGDKDTGTVTNADDCKAWESFVVKDSMEKSFWNNLGFGEGTPVTTTKCVTNPTILLVVIMLGFGALVIVSILLLRKPKGKKKPKKKKL